MIHYELTNTTPHTIDPIIIERALKSAADKAALTDDKLVTIEIVSPEESQAANKALRDHDEPTDIISVPTQTMHAGEQVITETEGALDFTLHKTADSAATWPVIGQLIICYDIVSANAKRAGQGIERELEWVIEHGILHVLGFHHAHDE